MTPQQINTRFLELTTMEEQCKNNILQLQANLNSIQGAKHECQYWVSQIAAPLVSPTSNNELPASQDDDAITIDAELTN